MKLKDFVTLGNLLSGFAAVLALFLLGDDPDRAFEWSCYLIYIGYVFDVLDGPVARLTKQFDTFGGIFDSVCDYITNSISPSFIIFFFYWKVAGVHWLIASIIGAFPIVFGTLRQAKQQDKPLSYPAYWLGLPRPVLTLFVLALLNSSVFTLGRLTPGVLGWLTLGVGALLIMGGSVLHLSHLPFCRPHGRNWMKFLNFGKYLFLAVSPVVFLVGWLIFDWPSLIYEFILFNLASYIFFSWTQYPAEDYRRIRQYIAGGPLIPPLVRKGGSWKTRTLAPFFLERDANDDAQPLDH